MGGGYQLSKDKYDENEVNEARPAHKYGMKTYGDYLNWDNDQRYEIIEGKVFNMAPAPYRKHQKVSIELARQFSNYLSDKDCEIYTAPFDVRLPEAEEDDKNIKSVVQPDISVICDLDKLDQRGCRGAPDLIIEILSSSTEDKDRTIKKSLYEKHGVQEYWLVNYEAKKVEDYQLNQNQEYNEPEVYLETETVPVGIFNGDLKVDLDIVFH